MFARTKSDLRQALDTFVVTLRADAPLRAVLSSRDVATQVALFDRTDAAAMGMQRTYYHAGRLSRWAGLLVVVVVPLKLLPIEPLVPAWAPLVINGFWMFSIVLTLLAIGWIGMRRPVAQRMQYRAEAERIRADVFRAIVRKSADVPGALPEALACFINAHLDWHIDYYLRRSQDLHGKFALAARTTARVRIASYLLSGGAALLGLVAIANFATALGFSVPYLSYIQWFVLTEPDRWQLGLNAAALSILAFANSISPLGAIDSDVRNVSTYPWAANELKRRRARELPAAEAAAAKGVAADVVAFCEAVQSIMDAEHLAWVSTSAPPKTA